MDNLEQFIAWIDLEFSDCSWYLEAQKNKYLHLYREDLDDFWSYEETVAWLTWQSRQAEIDEKDKKLKAVEQVLIELKESMTNFKEMDLYDKGVRVVTDCIIRDLEKAMRGEHES